MHFKIVTIFPKELSNSLSYGVVGNAINDNTIRIEQLTFSCRAMGKDVEFNIIKY